MRKGSSKNFWTSMEGISNLWCVFLERGSPPLIVGIERMNMFEKKEAPN
jgi:hypothetical protein